MSWEHLRLGEIAEFRNGLNYTKANEGTGLLMVNVKDFGDRLRPNYEQLGQINPMGITREESFLRDGDVLFVRSNGNKDLVGRSMYIDNPPENVSFSAFCIRARFHEKAIPRFYVYYFRSPIFRKRLALLGRGTNISNLNQVVLGALPVPFPPIEEQRRISVTVSSYDDLIENNRRRIQLLERAARLLYKEWFVRLRFPGHEHAKIKDGMPEGWEKKRIEDVCQTAGGGTPSTKKAEYWDGGEIKWVVPTDVTRNDCLALLDTEKKITEAGLRSSSARVLPPETILMTSRASVGFFALMESEACTNQGFINIIPHETWLKMYMLHNLSRRVEEIRSNAGGTTYKEISKGRFRQMPITVPTKQVAEEYEESAGPLLRQVRVLKKQQVKLAQARDLLLPRLMNGEIAA